MSALQYEVMYLEKGSAREKFSAPLTFQGAEWAARKMANEGFEVIAVVTSEHAAERRAAAERNEDGGPIPGAHLITFLNDIVRRFRQDYPGVQRESALEAISLLCTLSLEGEKDLQNALLDEIHSPGLSGDNKWRMDMQIAISNRRPEGE